MIEIRANGSECCEVMVLVSGNAEVVILELAAGIDLFLRRMCERLPEPLRSGNYDHDYDSLLKELESALKQVRKPLQADLDCYQA